MLYGCTSVRAGRVCVCMCDGNKPFKDGCLSENDVDVDIDSIRRVASDR